jgi:hypothetical protein
MLERTKKWSGKGMMNGRNRNLNGFTTETTDYLISKSQLKQTVREILAELLGVQTSIPQRKVYPISQAWRELGYDYQQQLYSTKNT